MRHCPAPGGGNIAVSGGSSSFTNSAPQDIGGASNNSTVGAGGTVIILTSVKNSSGTLNIGAGTGGTPNATVDNGAGIKPSSTGNNTYEVYGNLTLPDNLTIPAGVTVTIPSGAILTVPDGKTLTNNGTITGDGTLTLNGNANGNGSVSVSGFTKKDQTNAPSAPSNTSAVTANSVTLTAVTDNSGVGGIQYGYTTGAESSVPDTRWQTSTTFNNLSPGTAYTFYARYAGNGFYAPSAASSTGLTVTTSALVDAETPNITTHPQGGTYIVGADAALSVAASVNDGGTLSYQWYSNTTDSTTGGSEISGATSSSYNPPTSAEGTAYYYCVVTNNNSSATGKKTATATSNTAKIEVSPAAPKEYTITFDGNGGTSPAAQTTTNKKLTSLPTSTQSGYSFNGWYTAKTGGDKITLDTVFSASVTVYAQWTKDTPPQPAEYTITFDGNGGPSPAAQTTTGQKLTSLPTSTQSGYSFNGWYTAKTGGDKITLDTVFSANVTVYAQWTKDSEGGGDGGGTSYDYFTITASAGAGGSISPSGSVSVREGRDKTFTITPDSGYRISDVLVDGQSVGAVERYTFEGVDRGHAIKAVFDREDQKPGGDGPETDENEEKDPQKPGIGDESDKGDGEPQPGEESPGESIPQKPGEEGEGGGSTPQPDAENTEGDGVLKSEGGSTGETSTLKASGGNPEESSTLKASKESLGGTGVVLTRDESQAAFWLAVMLAAGTGLILTLAYNTKRKCNR